MTPSVLIQRHVDLRTSKRGIWTGRLETPKPVPREQIPVIARDRSSVRFAHAVRIPKYVTYEPMQLRH
eukprot:1591340-Prymnesium_polylepis.3